MTNIDVDLVADRFAELSRALRKHASEAAPGEVCVDDVQFARLAEFLRRYPDSPVAGILSRMVLGISEETNWDARAVDEIFRSVYRNHDSSDRSLRLALTKAIYDVCRADRSTNQGRLVEVIRVWGGVIPLSDGLLAVSVKLAEAWIAREARS